MLARPLLSASLLAMLAAASSPAIARPEAPSRLGETMRDPATQRTMTAAARAMSEALLNVRIAPFLRAIEAAHGGEPDSVDPDLSLRDYAGPEAERVPHELSRRLPAMMGAMGEMAGGFEAVLPELRDTVEDMRARIDDAIDQ